MYISFSFLLSGYDGLPISSSSNGIPCWLPPPSNYPNPPQQQYYPQESLTAANCSNSILPHWTPNDHLFADSISVPTKPLLTAQNTSTATTNNNVPSPISTLSNELDYISLNQPEDFQSMLSFPKQNAQDKDFAVDSPESGLARIANYRQSAPGKNYTSNVTNNGNRDLTYPTRQNVSDKSYVPNFADSGVGRSGWDAQFNEQCSLRTPDNILPHTPEAATQTLRTESVPAAPDIAMTSQYPWLVNRWTCF